MNKKPNIQTESRYIPKPTIESLKRDMEESGFKMSPFQESVAESVLEHIPASNSQADEMIAVLESITSVMKKSSVSSLSYHERQELELNRKCNEVTTQLKMLLNEITDIQSWRASFPYDPYTVEKRREIIEELDARLYEFARPIRETGFYRVLEESERNRRNQIEKHRQDSPHQ